MSRILVSLSVPLLSEQYDVFLNDDVRIEQLLPVVVQGVSDIASGKYSSTGREMLMTVMPDRLLSPFHTLSEYGVSDGAKLMMI